MVREGEQFMLHDQGGEKGPYTIIGQQTGTVGTFYKLSRVEDPTPSQIAWASAYWLHEGLRPGLHGEVGWLPVIPF